MTMTPRMVLLLAAPFLGLVAGGCVFVTTPCGTRIGFATTVTDGSFECYTASGDHVKAGVASSDAQTTAVIQALGAAFAAGAKVAVP